MMATVLVSAACVTAPDAAERLTAPVPHSAEHDSITAWWSALPYPNCQRAIGQVAFVQPIERVAGADVTLHKQGATHYTRTNENGQFRMPIDSGTWQIRVAVGGRVIATADLPILRDSIVPRLVIRIERPNGATLFTDTGGCARPPGYLDTLPSIPRRGEE
jgi:hypothetical protein